MRKISGFISFMLVLVLAFTCTACKFNTPQISNETEQSSEITNEQVVKDDDSSQGNVQAFEVSLASNTYNNYANYMSQAVAYSYSITEEEAYSMAVGCIENDIIQKTGCETSLGYVYINEETIIPGIIFTDWTLVNVEDTTIYNAGFVQLKQVGSTDLEITEDMVKQGVIACADGIENVSFLVNQFTLLDSFSFVYSGKYAKYEQKSNYIVEIGVYEDKRVNYDESIQSLYDFDNEKYIWESLEYKSIQANSYFSDEAKAYELARKTVMDIISLQDQNGNQMEISTIIIYVEEAIDQYLIDSQIGVVSGYSIDELNKVEATLEENQFLVVSPEGVTICSVPTVQELSDQRVANGWIKAITGALIILGAAVVTVATCGAGTPVLISAVAVVTGVAAIGYGACELIEGSQDLYYGYNKDIESESVNLGVELFKSFGLSEEEARKTYHAVGLSATLINQFTMPIGRVVSMTSGFFKTSIAVARVVLVESAKMALTGLASLVVHDVAIDVAVDLGMNPEYARLVGYGSALLSGMLVYGTLNRIDMKFNVSGLYPKLSMQKIVVDKTMNEVSKRFTDEQWAAMSMQEKKEAIYELTQLISKELGFDTVPRIKYYNSSADDAGFGAYYDGDDSIYINEYYMNNRPLSEDGIVDLIGHELTHRLQYYNLTNNPADEISYSYKNYIVYESKKGNWLEYRYQPCEDQAFRAGQYWRDIIGGLING